MDEWITEKEERGLEPWEEALESAIMWEGLTMTRGRRFLDGGKHAPCEGCQNCSSRGRTRRKKRHDGPLEGY